MMALYSFREVHKSISLIFKVYFRRKFYIWVGNKNSENLFPIQPDLRQISFGTYVMFWIMHISDFYQTICVKSKSWLNSRLLFWVFMRLRYIVKETQQHKKKVLNQVATILYKTEIDLGWNYWYSYK